MYLLHIDGTVYYAEDVDFDNTKISFKADGQDITVDYAEIHTVSKVHPLL
jgi:hypothetical protein